MKNENKSIKNQIQKHLSRGKSKLMLLERQILGEKNGQKLKDEFAKGKEKLAQFKKTFDRYEQKAVRYTEENPKKALAMAGAAGILAGVIWSSFRKKESPSPKPINLNRTKKSLTRKGTKGAKYNHS